VPFLTLYPDFVFAEPHRDNVAAVKSLHVPILIIHGEKDSIIVSQHGKEIFSSANEPKKLVLLPNCGHNDIGLKDSALFNTALKDFLLSLK